MFICGGRGSVPSRCRLLCSVGVPPPKKDLTMSHAEEDVSLAYICFWGAVTTHVVTNSTPLPAVYGSACCFAAKLAFGALGIWHWYSRNFISYNLGFRGVTAQWASADTTKGTIN